MLNLKISKKGIIFLFLYLFLYLVIKYGITSLIASVCGPDNSYFFKCSLTCEYLKYFNLLWSASAFMANSLVPMPFLMPHPSSLLFIAVLLLLTLFEAYLPLLFYRLLRNIRNRKLSITLTVSTLFLLLGMVFYGVPQILRMQDPVDYKNLYVCRKLQHYIRERHLTKAELHAFLKEPFAEHKSRDGIITVDFKTPKLMLGLIYAEILDSNNQVVYLKCADARCNAGVWNKEYLRKLNNERE